MLRGNQSMNLYLVSQDVNGGYDTFDSFIVAANSIKEAQSYHPINGLDWDGKIKAHDTWCDKEDVTVQLIGKASKDIEGIILASFNAG